MLMAVSAPAPQTTRAVPGPLTPAEAADLFCVIAKHERLRILGLALATRSVSIDELEAIGVGDRDTLMAHLHALADKGIVALTDDDGVVGVEVRSAFTKEFFDATRVWMADLCCGSAVVE